MGKFITIVIIILLIIGGYYLFFNNDTAPITNNNQETPVNNTVPANTSKQVTVNYTDDGFSPSTVTINREDTVLFVNQSSETMWVASAPHPTHTDYPEFDEKAAVSNGGSWSFIFDKVGTWKYHNHRDSSNTGTIVVQ